MSRQEQNDRHIIWSDISLDLDDWRESLEELYPGYSDDELYDIMVKSNAENLYDERVNLNIQLSQPIIVIGDLGRWNGRVSGYKMIDSGNIKDCLYSDTDYNEWYLAELLKDENNQLWSQVLYGIGYSDDQIVTVALSQVGNVGGQPYWSWYGFDSRVEWCACFVSWCANECGYIDAGIIPKYAGCVNGVQWFRDRGQWADGSYEPSPGTIIFFDWEGDGVTDHTGIVQKCENGTVYTVEGNSGDTCRTKTYPVGSSVIYGYGIPAY